MPVEGTMVNGVVVLDVPERIPNGTRVMVIEAAATNHATELAAIREGFDDWKAGRTRPIRETIAELSVKYGLPPVDDLE